MDLPGAGARRAIGEGARLAVAALEELGERADAERCRYADHERHGDATCHRNKVTLGVVGQILEEALVHGERRVGGHQEGVAVRRGTRRACGTGVAAAAGHVLHDELLPENLAERLRENARVKVCAAARAARHDQLDWPRWPLRAGGAGGEQQQESANLSHRAGRSYHVSFCTEARPSPRPATSAQSFSLTSATAPRSTRPWAMQRRSRSSTACS